MGGIYSTLVSSTGAGGTSDTFDNIGTFTLRPDTLAIIGVNHVAAPVTGVAAEAFLGLFRYSSSDLEYAAQLFPGPPGMGGAPATNIGHNRTDPAFVPLAWTPGERSKNGYANARVVCDFTTELPDVAAACAVGSALEFVGGQSPPIEVQDAIKVKNRGYPMSNWGGDADSAVATTVAETDVADLDIPGIADYICALSVNIAPDAFAAEEGVVAARLRASGLNGWEPQEWLGPGWGAPLGTAVGTGYNKPEPLVYPAYFDLTGYGNVSLDPKVIYVAATTTSSPTVQVGVAWA